MALQLAAEAFLGPFKGPPQCGAHLAKLPTHPLPPPVPRVASQSSPVRLPHLHHTFSSPGTVSLLFAVAALFCFEGGVKGAMERLYTTIALAYVSAFWNSGHVGLPLC